LGQLLYGSPPEAFELDDRTLAHLEIVTLAKLRRREPFAIQLETADGGRSTIWIGTDSTLRFTFGPGEHEINRTWLEALIDAANSPAGLKVLPEGDS
jgi:hypothetical protein